MNLGRKRRILKEYLEQITGLHIFRVLPQGVDLFSDIERLLPNFHPQIVFDVGANVGQSAREFDKHFPTAQIYCFEPVAGTFNKLVESLKRNSRVHCFQIALGEKRGAGWMHLHQSTVLNYLRNEIADSDAPTQAVSIETVSEFCKEHAIEKIDLLKIDVEGMDLNVLKGATDMLNDGRIAMIVVEAGMNLTNKLHVPFREFLDFLEPNGYRLFGVYEQIHEWCAREPQLRRSNLAFLSDSCFRSGPRS